MTTTPTTPTTATTPRPRRAVVGATRVLLVAIASLTLVAVGAAVPAGAQSATTVAPPTTLPAENPNSTAAGVVFFLVCGIVVVGALVLYLRNRRPRVPQP